MGRGISEFEDMQQAYIAIKDIDAVISSDSNTKLEDAWNVISEINKERFDQDNVNIILSSIRAALVKIFSDKQDAINDAIMLTRGK